MTTRAPRSARAQAALRACCDASPRALMSDALAAGLCALLAYAAMPEPAYAYVDPSVMTYTIQALAGVAVALGAVAGVAFRRTRRMLFKALGIDENARKTPDPDFSRVAYDKENAHRDLAYFNNEPRKGRGEGSGAKHARGNGRAAHGEGGGRKPDSYIRRLVLTLVVSVFAVGTLLGTASVEILVGGGTSLVFGLFDTWKIFVTAAAAMAIALVVVLPLFRGRVFNVLIMLLFSFGLCCYVQALFLNEGLPSMDGRSIAWQDYQSITLVSAAAWIAIMVVPLELSRLNRRFVQTLAGIAATALIIVQGVAVGSLVSGEAENHRPAEAAAVPASEYVMTQDGLFDVSASGKNVIVFVLDTYDTTDMMNLLLTDPSFSQKLAGFTWFSNSVGAMSPTRYGVPYLLTGEYPAVGEALEDYIANRYKNSSFLADVEAAGYEIGVYSDTLADMALTDEERRTLIYDRTVNIYPPTDEFINNLDTEGALHAILQCALYRDLPWAAKPFCYLSTDDMNQLMVNTTVIENTSVPYLMDDAGWYENLQRWGLSFMEDRQTPAEAAGLAVEDEASQASDQPAPVGAFRFIHLLGTHMPYVLNEDGTQAEGLTSLEAQAHGSMAMVSAYIDQLKKLGVFDDALIVITADHGIWWESYPGPLPWVSSAVMLVKPPGQSADQELQQSTAEITAHDMFPTIAAAIGVDVNKYGGRTIFEQDEVGRDRRYILTHCVQGADQVLVEYSIVGDVSFRENWAETGNTWNPSETPQP